MKKLQQIPVLGKIARVFSSFVKAPDRFDTLFAAAHENDVKLSLLREKLDQQAVTVSALEDRIAAFENVDPLYARRILSVIRQDYEGMSDLNRTLSSCPTVWGDPERLHISPDASVHSCFFNTNSGHITIGAYTFSGSHVSILAGSHDPLLRGSLRRDADYREGFDITIGTGVWLASGCTVLGPCTIGDNAVIAAGAVVVPGTNVPANAVYAGVPARLVKKLDFSDKAERTAVSEGLERNGGFLFLFGWSQRLSGYLPVLAYKLLAPEASVWTTQATAKLLYCLPAGSPVILTFVSPAGEKELVLDPQKGELALEWPGEPGKMMTLCFRKSSGEGDIFLALLPS